MGIVESIIEKLPNRVDAAPQSVPGVPRAMRARRAHRLGEILMVSGKLSEVQVMRVLKAQAAEPMHFGELAVKLGLIGQADLRRALATQFSYPYLDERTAKLGREVFTAFRPFSRDVEHLRDLRSNLILRWFRRDQHGLAMVGTRSGSGCSYLTANLGVLFAQTGAKTLIVDADLRTPRQHLLFQADNRFGLTDALSGQDKRKAIVPIKELPGLSLLPSGTLAPNPQELLVGDDLPKLMQVLSREFAVVLVDTSPCLLSADAQTVISAVGGAAIVVRKDRTPLAEIRVVQEQCETAGAQLIGSIFNRY
jgi:protein-tyrosine kinase